MKRQQPCSRHKPLQPKEAWNRLVNTGESIRIFGTLSDGQIRRVTEAVDVLKIVQTSSKRNKYKRFLYDVLRSGPQVVLVCAAGLGQAKVADMRRCDRIGLIREIEKNKGLKVLPPQ